MYTASKNIYRERVDFAKIPTAIPIPNLIEIQKNSYERFLQMRVLPQDREDAGLQSVFKSVFPITDLRENCSLEFVEYAIGNWECKCGRLVGLDKLGRPCTFCGATIIMDPRGDREIHCAKCGHLNENKPVACDTCDESVGLKLKYDVDECQERGMTFAVPLKVTIRLVVWDRDPETGAKSIRDIKEQEVYFGDIPLMTENGTFIINGTERVIVSQLHRSPGVFFSQPDKGLFAAQIIPYRGSWIEFEYDAKNILHVRIDRKRKFLGTVFLRALGIKSDADLIRTFYTVDRVTVREGKLFLRVSPSLVGQRLSRTVHGPKDSSGKRDELLHAGKKVTQAVFAEMQKLEIEEIEITEADLEGAFSASEIVDPRSGEVVLETNDALGEKVYKTVLDPEAQVGTFDVFFPERDEIGPMISNTVKKDSIKTTDEALIEIYRRMRPGDPPTLDSSRNLFESMFLNPQKHDFSRVGRLKLNTKLGLSTPLSEKIITLDDVKAVVGFLLRLRRNPAEVDDIDHLGNRRVRSVGELLENQFRIGLVRMERAIKEKMSVYQEMATAMPHDLINAKPVMASIREFFGSSQLSQFMDQTNPLSEITHKRRLSALGPGGLSRERAGFEVRDVHPTHYGRICPIETPEGPNIGLISSLSCFARINEFGFIESPYRKVKSGKVLDYYQVLDTGESHYKVGDIVEKSEMEQENQALTAPQEARGRGRALLLLPLGLGRGPLHHRPGQHRPRQGRRDRRRPGVGAQDRQLHPGAPRGHRLPRRLAQAARVGRRLADPVPRARRREPRADGFQHAAPGRAPAALGSAARRHRHGAHHGEGLRRRRGLPPQRHGRQRRLAPHHHSRRGRVGSRQGQGDRRRHLQPDQVQVLEPEHQHQPEADRQGRASG